MNRRVRTTVEYLKSRKEYTLEYSLEKASLEIQQDFKPGYFYVVQFPLANETKRLLIDIDNRKSKGKKISLRNALIYMSLAQKNHYL